MSQHDDQVPEHLLGGPISWMARNSVAANLFMFIIFVGGFIGLTTIKQEVFPEFQVDAVIVSVPYPGATPEDVEQGVVQAIEEEVRGIDGVKRVTSTSAEGLGTVTVELLLDADQQQALADVKNAVDRITSFPEEVEEPQIALPANKREVISVVVSGDMDLRSLHDIAELVRTRLLTHEDVTQVDVDGLPPLEIAVEVRREDLERYGISLQQIAQLIGASSRELPGGELETDAGEFLVRLDDRKRTAQEFADIVVRATADGAVLRLGDVATITDGYEDNDLEGRFNGHPAVRVTAYRVGDETPSKVASAVKEKVVELQDELPSTVTLTTWNDQSELLEGRIQLLLKNAAQGLVLVVIVLALFLNLRLAFWVAMGIPISFFGAFLLLPAMDQSINMVSLFAFIITLGLVVDDAIVVGENVYERMTEGMSPLAASIQGAREMAVPVTFAVLTTVAAFSPLLFAPGFSGKIFRLIPMVVISVLLFSLVEGFVILPAHLGHGRRGPTPAWQQKLEAPGRWVAGQLEAFTKGPFLGMLRRMLQLRYISMGAATAVFFVSVGLVAGGVVPFSFFPKLEADVVTATARLPYGAPIEQTRALAETLERTAHEALAEAGGAQIMRGMYTRVGEGPNAGFAARETGSHLLTVELNLVPYEDRDIGSEALAAIWREKLPELMGVEALKVGSSGGPGAGAAVDVQLSHADTEVLAAASTELANTLRTYSDLTNIENSYTSGKPQLDYIALPAADTLGLGPTDVGQQIRASFFGAEALREQRGRNEVKVMVRLPKDQRSSEYDLEQLRLRTAQGAFVPLSYVAELDRGRAPTAITREGGDRIVNVSAELAQGVKSEQQVLNALKQTHLPALKAKHPGLKVDFAGQQREQAETFASLGRNYILALFVIFALLAIPFKSYVQPVIIMSAIPFGLVGAILGHLIMGYGLSIISMFGIIALSGVVVNDSLVLVDAANGFRAQGLRPSEAIIAAAQRRIRPILLTSLTTFFGLLPMIFETSLQARFLIPMAISLGFGVLFVTVIVLLLVPALYLIVEDARALVLKDVQAVRVAPAK